MRPLTPEETAVLRTELRWWKGSLIASAVFAFVVLLLLAGRGLGPKAWSRGVPMVLAVVIIDGAIYFGVLRSLRRDLADGFAETMSGLVEGVWRRKNGMLVTVAGRDILVRAADAPAVGEHVAMDFLPRSKRALKVTKLGSAP